MASKRQRRNSAAQRHQSGPTTSTPTSTVKAAPRLRQRAYRPPKDITSPGGWTPTTAQQEYAPGALPRIRSAARDLAQNNPYASRAISVLTQHAVGTGIRASVRGDDEFERAFETWAGSTESDREGRLTLYGLQNLATRVMFEAGDALIIMREKRLSDRLTLTLQVIDPEQLHAGAAPRESGNKVFQGVEVYPSGQIFGYHVRLRLDDSSAVFIPRRDAVHLLELLYPGQMRGIPRGAQALARANNVDQFMSTALARAKIEACLTAFVTTDHPDDAGGLLGEPGDPDSGFLPPERLEPGLIVPLAPGEDVKVAQPPSSGGMADYVKIGLQSVAVAYGVTYDAISGDLEKVNFSSQKAGRLEFNRGIDSLRAHTIFPAVRKIIARFKEVFEANAARSTEATVTLVAPGRESVEPLKDAQTLSLDLQMGVKTWAQAVRERGHDPDDQIRELADIAEKFKAAGMNFKLDLGPVQITADPDPEDENPDVDPDDPDTTA